MQHISTSVLCGGYMHTISLTRSGAFVLHDHPALREELALFALGGEPPPCLEILLAWKQEKIDLIPDELRTAFYKTRGIARRRAKARAVATADLLTIPFAARIKERVIETAQRALAFCAYRRAQEYRLGGWHYVNVNIGKPHITGYTRWEWPKQDSYIDVTIPLVWLTRVYRRGLAVVDGRFVLDILAEDERGILVLAGRQGQEFEVYPCHALVVRGANNIYHIRRWE